ncbi:SAF domain-containing protein [Corynebacterium uterequi]|uniref:SAF domain-containing protein n=1 Tax=Corynebacterium uterequi TaxID=1072256 RepID=A0A0G3HBD0_9CORY|nr:SAF domain-containing protein [Corynebacterium uterequi]AKK10701.1 SAF domain-containing protein [Corynebacterium uterequi]
MTTLLGAVRSLTIPGYRRRVFLHRIAAAVLLLSAVAWAAHDHVAEDPAVVVFAADLPVGHELVAADLQLAHLPHRVVPHGAVGSTEDALGRVTVTAVGAGEVVTTSRVTGSALATSLAGEEATTVPVRLADPTTVALLRHGDGVTVVTAGAEPGGEPVIVATGGKVVLADPEHPDSVLIAFPPEQAHAVAAAALATPLGVVID